MESVLSLSYVYARVSEKVIEDNVLVCSGVYDGGELLGFRHKVLVSLIQGWKMAPRLCGLRSGRTEPVGAADGVTE